MRTSWIGLRKLRCANAPIAWKPFNLAQTNSPESASGGNSSPCSRSARSCSTAPFPGCDRRDVGLHNLRTVPAPAIHIPSFLHRKTPFCIQ